MSRNYLDETYEEVSETGKKITRTGFQKLYIPVGSLGRPGHHIRDLRAIVIHAVEDISTPAAIRSRLEQGVLAGSTHFIIGQFGDIMQIIPENEIAIHCKSGFTKLAHKLFGKTIQGWDIVPHHMNEYSIGITLCPIDKYGKFSPETLEAAGQLITALIKADEVEILKNYENRIKFHVLKKIQEHTLVKYNDEIEQEIDRIAKEKILADHAKELAEANLKAENLKEETFVKGDEFVKVTEAEILRKYKTDLLVLKVNLKEKVKKDTLQKYDEEIKAKYTAEIQKQMIRPIDILVTQHQLSEKFLNPRWFTDYPEELQKFVLTVQDKLDAIV